MTEMASCGIGAECVKTVAFAPSGPVFWSFDSGVGGKLFCEEVDMVPNEALLRI